jgi:hypothetical protein
MTEERSDEARLAIEKVVQDFVDVFVHDQDDEGLMHLPVLQDWVLLTVHDDAIDPTIGASYRMCRKNQSTHQTAGLLTIALDQFLHPERD